MSLIAYKGMVISYVIIMTVLISSIMNEVDIFHLTGNEVIDGTMSVFAGFNISVMSWILYDAFFKSLVSVIFDSLIYTFEVLA